MAASFGPDHAPLEQRQVAHALEEAQNLVPRPRILVFSVFRFDPEAAKDIDETRWPGVAPVKARMNADLLTSDLRKKGGDESFRLVGQPDVGLEPLADGEFRVSARGFDYFDSRSGALVSGKDIEIPSDYSGVEYIRVDDGGAWKIALIKELKGADFDVDANRV